MALTICEAGLAEKPVADPTYESCADERDRMHACSEATLAVSNSRSS